MINIVIIDDEPLGVELILEYLSDYKQAQVRAICHDGYDGLKAIRQINPDLIFLDIQMPKITGLEMLELLENPPAVIFMTAYDEYAVRAFDAQAIDYLLKPISKQRFRVTVDKFFVMGENIKDMEKYNSDKMEALVVSQRIVIKNKNEIKIISFSSINYLEANDDYVNIYTDEGKFLKNKTMKFFEQALDPSAFVRVHRSYIVKVAKITKIEGYEKDSFMLILKSGDKVPVSKSGYSRLKLAFDL